MQENCKAYLTKKYEDIILDVRLDIIYKYPYHACASLIPTSFVPVSDIKDDTVYIDGVYKSYYDNQYNIYIRIVYDINYYGIRYFWNIPICSLKHSTYCDEILDYIKKKTSNIKNINIVYKK